MGIMTERLRERADPVYREFMAGILPTVDKSTILGVRAPSCASWCANCAACPGPKRS